MIEEKNIKNTAVMAELYELSSCTSGIVPESKLSHKPQAQYGFVPKLSHPSGKNLVSLKNNFVHSSSKLQGNSYFPRFMTVTLKRSKGHVFFSAKRDVFSSDAGCGLEQTH